MAQSGCFSAMAMYRRKGSVLVRVPGINRSTSPDYETPQHMAQLRGVHSIQSFPRGLGRQASPG